MGQQFLQQLLILNYSECTPVWFVTESRYRKNDYPHAKEIIVSLQVLQEMGYLLHVNWLLALFTISQRQNDPQSFCR